jgi:hypothetical protein
LRPRKVLKQVEVGEDDREMLAVVIHHLFGDEPAVNPKLTGLRRVEPDHQLGESGLAAAVAAGQENQLARRGT